MLFSDKLSRLLALTETQSAQLAKALLVDASQISRMKTGVRNRPHNTDMLWRIAMYFSEHCQSNYRLSALAELTGNRAIIGSNNTTCADIIFKWLTTDDDKPSQSKEEYLQKVDAYTAKAGADDLLAPLDEDNKFVAFFNNDGKRKAIIQFLKTVADGGEADEIYFYTDENTDWVYEINEYNDELVYYINKLTENNCQFYHIAPPVSDLDRTIKTIERWLPAYTKGALHDFFYPRLRDELHRRTVYVVPGKIALFSQSLAQQNYSRLIMLSTDKEMVDVCRHEVLDMLQLCRPAMKAYTIREADAMFDCLAKVAAMPANGIYKTSSLSVATQPEALMQRIYYESHSPIAERALVSKKFRKELRLRVLQEHTIEDIMLLDDIQDVIDGKVAIPTSKMLPSGTAYYTPNEYRMHLEEVIHDMENNHNYSALLTDAIRLKDLILYIKGSDNVLLIKESNPFAVFDLSGTPMARNFYEYTEQLAQGIKEKYTRVDTLNILREMVEKLKAIKQI